MATATDDRVFRVLDGYSFDHQGVTYVMRRGDVIDGSNPAFNEDRFRRGLLEEVSADAVRQQQRDRSQVSAVETAMAAPGRPRALTTPPDPVEAPTAPPAPAAPEPQPASPQAGRRPAGKRQG